MSNRNVIARLKEITKGRRWYFLEPWYHELYDGVICWKHSGYTKFRKSKKYGMRKSYFAPYESHRKRGVEYLPF
jgi:hypothetical protein